MQIDPTRFPEFPSEPDGQGEALVPLRYEDVTQDGRIALIALPNGVGEAVWRAALSKHPARDAFRSTGIVPILTRFVIEGGAGPFAVDPPLEASGRYQFAHSVDASGEVDRLYLNMWVDLHGPIGRTWDPQPEGAGSKARAGRVFAEHVLTKLFAPPEERRVRRVDLLPGVTPIPSPRYAPRSMEQILELAPDAEPLEAALRTDGPPITFGLVHTDSNQHVNSLVYPQLFEELAIRRLSSLGIRTPLLARSLEIAYRKPCFATDRVQVALRCWRQGDHFGAVGAFLNSSEVDSGVPSLAARPYATVWMRFEP